MVLDFLYLIFLGILVFFSASCTKEEKGDEINKNQQTEGEETKRSSEAFNKNNKLWSTLDDPVKDGWSTEKLGVDMTKVTSILTIKGAKGVDIGLGNVRLESDIDAKPGCDGN